MVCDRWPRHAQCDPLCPRGGLPVDHAAKNLALRRAAQGDVIVLDGGGLLMSAMGELAFAHLVRQGAQGVVLNGCVRDVEQLEQMDLALPVFALGTAIQTVAGHARILDVGATVYIQGIRIDAGDLVAGCRGGVVVVPWADRAAVLEQAQLVGESDRRVREGIARGESMSRLWTDHKNI